MFLDVKVLTEDEVQNIPIITHSERKKQQIRYLATYSDVSNEEET